MANDYQAPSWSRAPQPRNDDDQSSSSSSLWTLVEIKNGTEIAQHELSHQACTVLGRAADMVDIELAHESCSRRHARIAFDNRGIPWLKDLASTHGTTVNKKSLPAVSIGKDDDNESTLTSTKAGSRGVVLFPGDILQFGASTRLFCLEGPPEFERGAMKANQQQQQAQAKAVVVTQQPIHQQESDSINTEETIMPKTLDDDTIIPPQHQKAWETLQAKRYKQQNLLTESQRIEAKGEDQLSTGQERQLERNRQRIVSLQEDIDQMEQELLHKIYPAAAAAAAAKGGGPNRLFNAADEEDDVDDRTQQAHTHQNHFNEVEREETLIIKWKQGHSDYINLNESMDKAHSKVMALKDKVTHAAIDAEDAFFLQNELDLAQDVWKKMQQRRDEVLAGMKDSEMLLRIVNDKIVTDLDTGYIGTEKMAPPPSAQRMAPLPPSAQRMAPPPPASSKVMPPPSFSSMPPPALGKKMPPPSPPSNNASMLPPPQSKRVIMPPPPSFTDNVNVGIKNTDESVLPIVEPNTKRARTTTVMLPPPFTDDDDDRSSVKKDAFAIEPPQPKRARTTIVPDGRPTMSPPPTTMSKGPRNPAVAGTLSFLGASQNNNGGAPNQQKKGGMAVLDFDGKKDEWVAPKGQDGSGRTKLNEKFAGRY